MRSKKEITPIWFQLISSIESENIKKIFRILMKNNNLFLLLFVTFDDDDDLI